MVTHARVLSCLSLVVLMMLSPVVLGMGWRDLGLGMGQHELSGMVPPLSPPGMAYCTVRAQIWRKSLEQHGRVTPEASSATWPADEHGLPDAGATVARPSQAELPLHTFIIVCHQTTMRLQNGDNSTVLHNDSTFSFKDGDTATYTIDATDTTLINAVPHVLSVLDTFIESVLNHQPALHTELINSQRTAYEPLTMLSATMNELLPDVLLTGNLLLDAQNCRPNPSVKDELSSMENELSSSVLPDDQLLNARNCRPNPAETTVAVPPPLGVRAAAAPATAPLAAATAPSTAQAALPLLALLIAIVLLALAMPILLIALVRLSLALPDEYNTLAISRRDSASCISDAACVDGPSTPPASQPTDDYDDVDLWEEEVIVPKGTFVHTGVAHRIDYDDVDLWEEEVIVPKGTFVHTGVAHRIEPALALAVDGDSAPQYCYNEDGEYMGAWHAEPAEGGASTAEPDAGAEEEYEPPEGDAYGTGNAEPANDWEGYEERAAEDDEGYTNYGVCVGTCYDEYGTNIGTCYAYADTGAEEEEEEPADNAFELDDDGAWDEYSDHDVSM